MKDMSRERPIKRSRIWGHVALFSSISLFVLFGGADLLHVPLLYDVPGSDAGFVLLPVIVALYVLSALLGFLLVLSSLVWVFLKIQERKG